MLSDLCVAYIGTVYPHHALVDLQAMKDMGIVAVHLAGNPCDMNPIMDITRRHGLKVIEDCTQSYLTGYKGRLAGTFGDYGCFSTNDFKHISTGDGGIVTVNSGEEADYHATQRSPIKIMIGSAA